MIVGTLISTLGIKGIIIVYILFYVMVAKAKGKTRVGGKMDVGLFLMLLLGFIGECIKIGLF